MQRRIFLKASLTTSILTVAISAGLLSPRSVLADWPKSAFSAKRVEDVLVSLLGNLQTYNSDDIKIYAPDTTDNGANVPITITTSIPDVKSISLILDDKHNKPLIAHFKLFSNAKGYVSTTIKMGLTADVIAVINIGGKNYSAQKNVELISGVRALYSRIIKYFD